jgi:hypothetical protein
MMQPKRFLVRFDVRHGGKRTFAVFNVIANDDN